MNAIRIEKAVAIGAQAQGVVSLSQWTSTEVEHLRQKRQTVIRGIDYIYTFTVVDRRCIARMNVSLFFLHCVNFFMSS